MKKRVIFLSVLLFLLLPPATTLAEDFTNGQIAKNLPIADTQVSGGDIISRSGESLIRAKTSYDKNLVGVVVTDPSVSLNKVSEGSQPVISYGEAKVKVSNQNGSIKVGDFITSSKTAGTGQKATESGFVLGKATEDLKEKSGQITVFINIQYRSITGQSPSVTSSLSKLFNVFSSKISEPGNFPVILRYILAIILAGGSFLLGFNSFIKAMRKGIDSIGRNPLAKRNIQLILLLNLVGIAIISLAGVGLALFIIFY